MLCYTAHGNQMCRPNNWFGYIMSEPVRRSSKIIGVAISSQVCPFHPRLTGLVATH